MSYEMKVRRGRDGLVAETEIDLGIDRRFLSVTTSKTNRGVLCSVNAVQRTVDESNGYTGFVWAIGRDYHARLVFESPARATEAKIRSIHAQGLARIEPHIEAAKRQYAPKTQAEASTHDDAGLL